MGRILRFNILIGIGFFLWTQSTYGSPCFRDAIEGIYASAQTPALTNETQDLIDQGLYQQAIWKLKESSKSQHRKLAKKLEKDLVTAMETNKIEKIRPITNPDPHPNIRKGKTESHFVELEDGIQGIFKPFDKDRPMLAPEHEVAAYELDQMLKLNRVPTTVYRTIRGRRGSLQYFVPNMDKAITATGRKSSELRFFDILIFNHDRISDANLKNFMTTTSGRLIAFDNAAGFFATKKELHYTYSLERAWPSDKLLQRVKSITDDDLKARLGQHLTDTQIELLKVRRNFLLREIEKANRAAKVAKDYTKQGLQYEAIWALKDSANPKLRRQGHQLEKEYLNKLKNGKLTKIKDVPAYSDPQIHKGQNKIFLLTFEDGTEAIFKQGRRSITSRSTHEVAAYRLDQLLNLNMVPPTTIRTVNGVEGTVQPMIRNTQRPAGIGETHRNQEFFNYWLDVIDRHDDGFGTNYLVTRSGRQVLYDNGAGFPSELNPIALEGYYGNMGNDGGFPKVIPEWKVYNRLKNLSEQTVRDEMRGLLKPEQIETLLKRRKILIKQTEDMMEMPGMGGPSIWPPRRYR